ncbi:MAG TPA: hydantoinase/oxoprolinase family protein [Solirubrobacteraceae bacterium]|nr:hydantoinase/oxoprolinase family protein [Solirubrobacteraceae bacterium]
MRLSVDTGGTFSDLVVEQPDGCLALFKSPTVREAPVSGVMACLDLAAAAYDTDRTTLLRECEMFIHGTTRGINAILTGTTARTAFLTTAGHPDILLYREGGRSDPFNHRREYPAPYVPRRLTYEIEERIGPSGSVIRPLADDDVRRVIRSLREDRVEAIGVCLLWSVVNPAHELRVGELLAAELPGVPVTLSHRLNPTIREYRRASSSCIDASLKPLMSDYFSELEERLRAEGFNGRLLIVSSSGGLLDVEEARDAPIHTLGSGPAMAPVAGRHIAASDNLDEGAPLIVTDAGGTSFEVSLVRNGVIPRTRETWLREPYSGDITGFPSVDVKSIGAGGGSIAWVDDGGLLRIGPMSAGSDPGPACYPNGGERPTLTDACVVLGLLDPAFFLGGRIGLDRRSAEQAVEREIATPLGIAADSAAAAVLELATEQMVRAIEDMAVYRGVDPSDAVLLGGGGAAGFNVAAIAGRLGCRRVLLPSIGPGLSAAGGLLSNLFADYVRTVVTVTTRFDYERVNRALADLIGECRRFAAQGATGQDDVQIELFAEARYPQQVWELEVPLDISSFDSPPDVEALRTRFHATHQEVFGVDDPSSPVEVLSWRARVTVPIGERVPQTLDSSEPSPGPRTRIAYFKPEGWLEVPVYDVGDLSPEVAVVGPALVDAPQTTVVVYPGSAIERTHVGNLLINQVAEVVRA